MNAFGNSDISMAQVRTHQFIYEMPGDVTSQRGFTTQGNSQLNYLQFNGNATGVLFQWGMPERIQFNVPPT